MTKLLYATVLIVLMSTAAHAENLGITMGTFDDNFMTLVRNAMIARAGEIGGVEVQVEDAQNEVGKQLNQIQNFVATGVDAIIVTPADTDATGAMSAAAEQGGIPQGQHAPTFISTSSSTCSGSASPFDERHSRISGSSRATRAKVSFVFFQS